MRKGVSKSSLQHQPLCLRRAGIQGRGWETGKVDPESQGTPAPDLPGTAVMRCKEAPWAWPPPSFSKTRVQIPE